MFVRVKQVFVKIYLKSTKSYLVEVFDKVFYHLYIYKILNFELISKRLNKIKKITCPLKLSSSFLDKFSEALRLNFIFTMVILLLVLGPQSLAI